MTQRLPRYIIVHSRQQWCWYFTFLDKFSFNNSLNWWFGEKLAHSGKLMSLLDCVIFTKETDDDSDIFSKSSSRMKIFQMSTIFFLNLVHKMNEMKISNEDFIEFHWVNVVVNRDFPNKISSFYISNLISLLIITISRYH